MNIEVKANSIQEEFDYLYYLFGKKKFFKDNGYIVSIPNHQYFKTLWESDNEFSGFEFDFNKFGDDIYNADLYKEDVKNTIKELNLHNNIWSIFDDWEKWGFKKFSKYIIVFTAYGPGGSYNAQTGQILIKIKKNSNFNKPILYTIIHEIIHIGIEESIIKKFNLSHWEKEAVVDAICVNYFDDVLPNYHIQQKIDEDIFNLISKDNIDNLPNIIEEFKNKTI